jgi:hypothetical protein
MSSSKRDMQSAAAIAAVDVPVLEQYVHMSLSIAASTQVCVPKPVTAAETLTTKGNEDAPLEQHQIACK